MDLIELSSFVFQDKPPRILSDTFNNMVKNVVVQGFEHCLNFGSFD
jgi:hypothetical protein